MEKKIIRDGGEVLAVSYNNWVFFSQFTGRGASGTQVRSVISSLLQAAEKADVKPDGFVKMTVLLSDMDIYARFLADYQELVGGSFPALAAFALGQLPPGSEICLELIAISSESGRKAQRIYLNEGDVIPAAVRADDFIYTSVCASQAPGRFEEEAASSLDALLRILQRCGCKKGQAVRNRIMMTDSSHFGDYNAVYCSYFNRTEAPPARSLLGVKALPGQRQIVMDSIVCTANDRRVLQSDELAPSVMPFSQGIAAGGFVFPSGQIGRNTAGEFQHPLAEESRQMFHNLLSVMAAAGATAQDMLMLNSYLRNYTDEPAYKQIMQASFKGAAFAESCYAIDGFATPVPLTEAESIGIAR